MEGVGLEPTTSLRNSVARCRDHLDYVVLQFRDSSDNILRKRIPQLAVGVAAASHHLVHALYGFHKFSVEYSWVTRAFDVGSDLWWDSNSDGRRRLGELHEITDERLAGRLGQLSYSFTWPWDVYIVHLALHGVFGRIALEIVGLHN